MYESTADRIRTEAWCAAGPHANTIMAAAVRPLAHGSHVGVFGGAGLWNVGGALTRIRSGTSDAILTTNVDACRNQASAILVAREVFS
jgi:hypothetical protein